ncbi:cold shock domain-containing protein [bacterium]|nr:cold shock domain-containing protein [bacterium]
MSPQSNIGRVKFFDEEKGYGFVWSNLNDRSREVFVHSKQLSGGLKSLCRGNLISFRIEQTAKGLAATDVKIVNPKDEYAIRGVE